MQEWFLNNSDLLMEFWELRKRGWTERMIEKLLGEPGWIPCGWPNFSKRVYRTAHVEAVEAGSLFREQFLASAKRRKLDETFVGEVLKRSMELEQSGAIAVWQERAEEIRLAHERELEKNRLAREAYKAMPRTPPPPPSELVCCVDVATGFADWTISVRFMRYEGIDRVYCDENPSMKAEQETQGTAAEAVATLLPQVLSTLMHFGGPVAFAGPGLVDGRMFAEVVDELATRSAKIREANLEQADADVVTVARELCLTPEPSSRAAGCWDAKCPGTQHELLLNTSRDEFWCGYCKRSGDLVALRLFVEERKKRN